MKFAAPFFLLATLAGCASAPPQAAVCSDCLPPDPPVVVERLVVVKECAKPVRTVEQADDCGPGASFPVTVRVSDQCTP